jgi:shikimate dehydrogenase
MAMIDSSTQICISLAARPGSFGNRFHNYLYGELGLNFAYRSGTTGDLRAAVAGLRGLRIRGCGLSMPYKEQVLELLDEVEPTARRIGAVNTIVNEDVAGAGRLVGYNTDYLAVRELLKGRRVGPQSRVALAGSGGMARACAFALAELGMGDVTVLARNRDTGGELAREHGFRWAEPSAARPGQYDVLINATPIGMQPDPPERVPFPDEVIRSARLAVESVAYPPQTTFLKIAREAGLSVIEGFDITLMQGVEQFRLYTGVSLRPDQVARAAVFARASR